MLSTKYVTCVEVVMFYTKEKFIPKLLLALFLIGALWLTACGELEFGVETKVSSGRPEVTVVITTVAQVPENMVLVTVTAVDRMTLTPTAVLIQAPIATETAEPTITASSTAITVPTPTPQLFSPTPLPSLPTTTPSPLYPQISDFTPVTNSIQPGSSITLNWEGVGESALLCLRLPFTEQQECRSVPVSGPYNLTINPTYRTNLQLELHVYADGYESLLQDFLTLLCEDKDWFFKDPPVTCPGTPPAQTQAAIQQFEHGWMLWLSQDETIYVFFDSSNRSFAKFSPFQLPSEDVPLPNNEYDPPDGRYVPISGFGRLWRSNSWVRDSLGWALETESAFETTIQWEYQREASYLYLLNDNDELIVLNNYGNTWAVRH